MLSKTTLKCLCLFIVLLASFHTGSALRCWDCQSDTNPDCSDPFEAASHGPSACIPHATQRDRLHGTWPVCTKARIHVNDLETIVMRNCEWVSESNPGFCQHHPGLPAHSHLEFCETCRGDGCNAVGMLSSSSWIIATAILLLTLFMLNYRPEHN